MKKIYIIHENETWTAPLIKELEVFGLPYEDWFINEGTLDLSEAPPEGIFYNRMSASSHSRDHRYAPEYTAAMLAWLEGHGRKVINNSGALRLEISKVAQYASLRKYGIPTPHTIAVVGKEQIIKAAASFDKPFITKHNRGGKGLGVQKFENISALDKYVNGEDFEEPIDGITLIQEYIQSPEPFIIRTEFVGGNYLYSVKVNTSEGFQLCPADACQITDVFCPVGNKETSKFVIQQGYIPPLLEKYQRFLIDNGIHIAGIEFISNIKGEAFTYDINTNTNYNSEAEEVAGISGMGAIAVYLGNELKGLK
ncbi:MAG: alpha-L-glutamate ligase [Firmicutes bacterium]|nr:alpha-L-glutamate ligase [Bacillota bacterium]